MAVVRRTRVLLQHCFGQIKQLGNVAMALVRIECYTEGNVADDTAGPAVVLADPRAYLSCGRTQVHPDTGNTRHYTFTLVGANCWLHRVVLLPWS